MPELKAELQRTQRALPTVRENLDALDVKMSALDAHVAPTAGSVVKVQGRQWARRLTGPLRHGLDADFALLAVKLHQALRRAVSR